jgi:hypothetical protein
MAPYLKRDKKLQRERVKYWLLKDKDLTNKQICELTGATGHTVSKIRKELNLPATFGMAIHKTINDAFKKFMEKTGRPIQTISPEFNAWAHPSIKGNNENKKC